jgi:hypothetical protein
MRYLLVATLVAAFAVMMSALAVADPNPSSPPAHRHYVISPNGTYREVGPDLCGHPNNGGIRRAFDQFHANVHVAGAPGLHNHSGAEVDAVFGCGNAPPDGQ